MDKVALIIGIILGIVGLYKIDIVLIAGLNYFGKYVFFGLFNLFIVYIYYFSFKKSKFLSLLVGFIIFLLGVVLG